VRSQGVLVRVTLIRTLALVVVLFGDASVQAAAKAELWARWQKQDPASQQTIDHGAWERFLRQYVITNHPSGIYRVRYQAVAPEDFRSLRSYLQSLQGLMISSFNRAQQKAYWINAYNAIMVELVLSRYPVASVRDINTSPGLIERGPWGAKSFSVEGEKVSLDDIEHRILRPIWKDSRIHYALNNASLGSPNLQPAAYTNENTEALLERGAKEFVNHPRGVSIQKGKLQVSSLYIWFQEDFGRDAEDLMEHWQQYANPALADALEKYSGGLAHDYDWRLNGVEAKP